MGTWGFHTFEDDTACDWLGAFRRRPTMVAIEAALDAALAAEFIDDHVGPCALAAAEVVASLNGQPPAGLGPEVAAWVAKQPSIEAELLGRAQAVVARVVSDSELRDIWDDTGNLPAWETAVVELQDRLRKREK